MMVHGTTGVGDILLHAIVEEGVFDSWVVGSKDLEKVFFLCIASWYSVRTKNLVVFITGVYTYSCIDVTTNDNLFIWVNCIEY